MKRIRSATLAGVRQATSSAYPLLTHPSSFVAVGDVAPAVTRERSSAGCLAAPTGLRSRVAHVATDTIAPERALRLVARKGIGMSRLAPLTGEVMTAISDGSRALNVLFLADGVIDEREMDVIRGFRHAQAIALRADWSRRARQSIENGGVINSRLEREYRELEAEFGPEAA